MPGSRRSPHQLGAGKPLAPMVVIVDHVPEGIRVGGLGWLQLAPSADIFPHRDQTIPFAQHLAAITGSNLLLNLSRGHHG